MAGALAAAGLTDRASEPFNDRQPFDAASISLNTIVRHATRLPLSFVLSCRSRTVANVNSIGFVLPNRLLDLQPQAAAIVVKDGHEQALTEWTGELYLCPAVAARACCQGSHRLPERPLDSAQEVCMFHGKGPARSFNKEALNLRKKAAAIVFPPFI